jgi:type II secretory pathway component GspD/PulD (secretin)
MIVQTSREEYSKVSGLLQTLDRPAKGALIEVTVAELTLDDKNQLGVEWLTNKALSGGGSRAFDTSRSARQYVSVPSLSATTARMPFLTAVRASLSMVRAERTVGGKLWMMCPSTS